MFAGAKHLGALTRAVRNISRRKMRASLVIIALGFSLAIMISVPGGVVADQKSTQSLTQYFNSTISNMEEEINKTKTLIQCSTSPGRGMFFNSSSRTRSGMPRFEPQQEVFINETVGDEIRSINGVRDVVPFLEKSSEETISETISTPRGDFPISRPLYTITGVCLNSSLIDNYPILPANTTGRELREGDYGVVFMSQNLSEYFGVGVGGKVEINGRSFTIVGIYNSTTEQGFTGARTVYMNLTDAQTITGEIENVSRFDVYAKDISYVDGIAEVITAAYTHPQLYVTTYNDRLTTLEDTQATYKQTLSNAQSTLSQTQSVANQEITVTVVATSLIILFMMLYTVRERTKEIGTLKAIGFSGWNVMSQFMLEGVLLSLVAGVVGIAIGTVGAPILSGLLLPPINLFGSRDTYRGGFPTVVTNPGLSGPIGASASASAFISPQIMLLAIGAAALLGAVGSLYPAWRASRIRPAEAMRYE
jgi:putative ABC transport system permease protein